MLIVQRLGTTTPCDHVVSVVNGWPEPSGAAIRAESPLLVRIVEPAKRGGWFYARGVPSLYFYAVDDDYRLVLESVFGSDLGFRVFERQSAVNEKIREFQGAEQVLEAWAGGSAADSEPPNLALLAPGNGHAPTFTRIDLRGPGYERSDYDYRCEGWGLILLDFGMVRKGALERSYTSHNSERRARGRAAFYPRLGDPDAWDWAAVNSCSRALNRRIRQAAIRTEGSRPVLPAAHQATANGLTLNPT